MRLRVRERLIFKILCTVADAGAVNYQMLGAGAVSAPSPALRGMVTPTLPPVPKRIKFAKKWLKKYNNSVLGGGVSK